MTGSTRSIALAAVLGAMASGCGTFAALQDAEVVPTGEHRVGLGLLVAGGGDDLAFTGAVPFVTTRHGLAGDRLELRSRITPLPIGASLGLKVGLVGAPGAPGLHLALSADGGAYAFPPSTYPDIHIGSSAFARSARAPCMGDHGCSPQDPRYTVLEAALALGHRPSRHLALWLTPRVAHLTSLINDFTQTIVAGSVGVAGGRDVLIALELTAGADLATGDGLVQAALGFEIRL